MGANEWKHVPSLSAMGQKTLSFYLTDTKSTISEDFYALGEVRPPRETFVPLAVDLGNRGDVDEPSVSSGEIVDRNIDIRNARAFVSDAFERATEITGLFSGHLDFAVNKHDFDLEIDLYELTPDGEYIQLSFYKARASYIRNRSVRQLLSPDKREQLDFTSGRTTSREFRPGSRLVVEIRALKGRGAQINHGTGKSVSDETIKDSSVPLTINWYSETNIRIR
jgi:hypothetical protein